MIRKPTAARSRVVAVASWIMEYLSSIMTSSVASHPAPERTTPAVARMHAAVHKKCHS
jgi:hypothetical protein